MSKDWPARDGQVLPCQAASIDLSRGSRQGAWLPSLRQAKASMKQMVCCLGILTWLSSAMLASGYERRTVR